MEDCCTVFCCPGCAIIQLHKQIDPKTNILGLQKWEDTIYTFTYPLVFLKNKSGTFEKKLLSTSLISMSCVHQVLLPVSVITHRSHKQRKQPSVCILLDRCIALWPTNSIRETSSLFTPGQLWRHSIWSNEDCPTQCTCTHQPGQCTLLWRAVVFDDPVDTGWANHRGGCPSPSPMQPEDQQPSTEPNWPNRL